MSRAFGSGHLLKKVRSWREGGRGMSQGESGGAGVQEG